MTFTYANEGVALNSDFHKLNCRATQMSDGSLVDLNDGSLVDPTRPQSRPHQESRHFLHSGFD